MAEREMSSTAMSAKGRVRVSKHSAEELARLGRSEVNGMKGISMEAGVYSVLFLHTCKTRRLSVLSARGGLVPPCQAYHCRL